MSLKNNYLNIAYSSDSSNLVTDFYVPCLKESVLYRRAVGYFTSHGLSVAAQVCLDMATFVKIST